MSDAIVMIALETKTVGEPIKRHTLEGVMPPNSVQSDEDRHKYQSKAAVFVITITDGNRRYNE